MSPSLLILVGRPFTRARVSPATLLPGLLPAGAADFIHVTLAPPSEEASAAEVNYWNMRVTAAPSDGDSLYASFAARDRRGDRELLQAYSWLREVLRSGREVRWLHSFGAGGVDYVAAPLAAEFGLAWLRSSYADDVPDVAAPYTHAPLGDVDWARGLRARAQAARGVVVAADADLTLILPPDGQLKSGDLEAARSGNPQARVVLLEPLTFDSDEIEAEADAARVITLAPSGENELLTLLAMSGRLIVPLSGSWLAATAAEVAPGRVVSNGARAAGEVGRNYRCLLAGRDAAGPV